MHKIRFTFMLALLSAGILLASCKKDKNDEPTPSSSVTTDTTQVTPDNNPQNADNNGDNNPQNPDNPDNGENNPPTTNSIVINVAIESIEGIESQSFTAEDVLVVCEGALQEGDIGVDILVVGTAACQGTARGGVDDDVERLGVGAELMALQIAPLGAYGAQRAAVALAILDLEGLG